MTRQWTARLPSVRVVFLRRRERIALTMAAVAVGEIGRLATPASVDPLLPAIVIAMVASGPLAVSKGATACGLNSLSTFATPMRPLSVRLVDWIVYFATSTAAGALLGAILGWSGQWLRHPAAGAIVAFALVYLGLRELGFIRPTPPIASSWQVPARWVQRPRRAAFVWGLWLGPGLATQMPHPMFYGLLALATVFPLPTGPILIGMYGASRALPALLVARHGAVVEEWFRENAYRVRLVGHAVCGTFAIAAGVSLIGVVPK